MLTVETIKQNTKLSTLTVEQMEAIAEMSRNDENSVIGNKLGEVHGQYDTDILSITGVTKNSGEKSYDYLKRVLNANKASLESLNTTKQELESAKKKIADLEKKIQDGSQDETLKQQLKDAQQQVTQLQNQLTTKQTEFDNQKKELENKLNSTKVDYAFEAATAGLKFKAGITDGIKKTLFSAAKAEVLQRGTPEFQQNADGSQKLIFRNDKGEVLNNPKNNLNPYTFQELILETSIKDVIDFGKQQSGGGTGPIRTTSSGQTVLDLTGIKTQLEADKAIENYLLGTGITRDSAEFSTRSMEIRNENKVSELPLR